MNGILSAPEGSLTNHFPLLSEPFERAPCASPAAEILSPETNQNGFVSRYEFERGHVPNDFFPVSDAFDVSDPSAKAYLARWVTAVSANDLSQ